MGFLIFLLVLFGLGLALWLVVSVLVVLFVAWLCFGVLKVVVRSVAWMLPRRD